jgi:DNA polymerase V
MMMHTVYALVDCNNFYVSCERTFNGALHNRPVLVLSNNDGCVVARSNEAKALGIKMGQPVFECRELIAQHQIEVFSSNYALYADMSDRVMQTLVTFSPCVEVYSIDEAFLDLSHVPREQLHVYGHQIRQTVWRFTGLPVCVGIASTKTLTKVANEVVKHTPALGGCFRCWTMLMEPWMKCWTRYRYRRCGASPVSLWKPWPNPRKAS